MAFVEMTWFTKRLKGRLEDAAYRAFQQALLANPNLGDVMPGCGGLRKARWGKAASARGKRFGVRIIYLAIPEAQRIDLFDIYGKDEKDDLSAAERKELAGMVRQARAEAIAARMRARGAK